MSPYKIFKFAFALLPILLLAVDVQAQVSFPGAELLGRPTDTSVTINVVASAAIDAYFEYGTQTGGPYTQTSPAAGAGGPVSTAANAPLVVVLSGLTANTHYFYKMIYRQTGTTSWTTRAEHSFWTQRPPGSTFAFTVAADSHINIVFGNSALFQQTLQNIAGESPDFHFDLGDTFAMDNVTLQSTANSNYLNLRSYFGLISASAPVFLALGNHEQEEGWHLDDTGNVATSPPVMSANARNLYYLNPDPLLSSFYTGNTDTSISAVSGDHTIGDYYAFTWGDALFVVIDPYWYTTIKPYTGNEGGGESSDPGNGVRWDWTLGVNQYQWLEKTLQNSSAKYKFIFAHQAAGGIDDYGRGGANAVPYVEWGGYNDDGTTWAFDSQRAGWDRPVHQLLVKYNVTAFFHAHDHEFAYEKRDGVVYQLLPMAADATYGNGFAEYHTTDPYTLSVLPNSGHLRVTVTSSQVTVDYVRAFTSGAGTNGQIAYTYTMGPATTGGVAVSSVSLSPTSVIGGVANSTGTVTLSAAAPAGGSVVNLSSGNTAAATAPATVTVAANATSATFTVTSKAVSATTTSTITASYNGSATATLTVNPAATGLSSLSLNPTSIVGGAANSTGTVTLNGSAPSGGTVVTLASNNSAAASVPASVTVPANASSATFTVTSNAVTASASVTITATFGGAKTATLTVTPPASFKPVRINSGGPAYTDSLGQAWVADTSYTGGSVYTTTSTITNTADPTLYKTSRYGSSFKYVITAPAGSYTVTLKFAELYWTSAGKRVLNVAINGTTVLSNFDIFATAGASLKAVDKTFTVTSTGTITIQFSTRTAGNPLVNAIQVVAAGQ
ncbi:MAG: malectin domain-containing carbohydrate-binding protein [Candidatus Acidiferrales bacterium]